MQMPKAHPSAIESKYQRVRSTNLYFQIAHGDILQQSGLYITTLESLWRIGSFKSYLTWSTEGSVRLTTKWGHTLL